MGRVPSWSVGIVGSLIVVGTAVYFGYEIGSLDMEIADLPAATTDRPDAKAKLSKEAKLGAAFERYAKEAKIRLQLNAVMLNAFGLCIVMLKDLPWWKRDG